MRYYITFRQGSPYKNHYVIVEAHDWEHAHDIAKRDYAVDYSMVYSENQWYDYQGASQAQRFNLKEIK